MRASSSFSLALPALASLVLGLTMCTPPPVDDGRPGSDGSGSTSGSGADGTGATSSQSGGGPTIVTLPPPDVVNPCEVDGAPEECLLVAAPACGDGEINLEPPEPCDDGNSVPGDGCSGACTVEPFFECPTAGSPCVTTIECGDGVVGPGEACDDTNKTSGDGCADDCHQVEAGYRCRVAGESCVRVYICGDGTPDANEGCDDGGVIGGDGCDERCRMETGFKCDGSPSVCSPTTCGDNKVEGAESCDKGDLTPFDGCSPSCQAEPECATGEACTSSCGDGIMLNQEDCDDGNLRNGDGCSSSCEQEEGYVCSDATPCAGDDCTLTLPIVFRDFNASHSDFQESCSAGVEGVVETDLSATGKPQLASSAGACIASAASFNEWYTKSANNAEVVSSITLYDNGNGGYVNRFGPNGEQFGGPVTGNGRWCGDPAVYASCAEAFAAGQCNTPAFDETVDTCFTVGATKDATVPANCCTNCFCAGTISQEFYDGNPLFFPVDTAPGILTDTRGPARIPAQVYGANGWPWEGTDAGPLHNFHFTSEIAYWFKYETGLTADLTFIGDDDVWVFVNGELALDLGGIHVPYAGRFALAANGTITLRTWIPPDGAGADTELAGRTTTAAAFGLEEGNVYEIKVFHAERKMEGSSFQLTLSGFTAGRSDCVTNCGDGETGPGEECDDGTTANLGGYNQCTADCIMGPHCGDGVKQDEEACDYGEGKNTGEYGGCAANCQLGPHCGDGLASDAEKCDDGVNDGGYGECAQGCVLGPVCGDGGWQPDYEECDDGNNEDQDGCSGACKEETIIVK